MLWSAKSETFKVNKLILHDFLADRGVYCIKRKADVDKETYHYLHC
jgi:hypothetical protein